MSLFAEKTRVDSPKVMPSSGSTAAENQTKEATVTPNQENNELGLAACASGRHRVLFGHRMCACAHDVLRELDSYRSAIREAFDEGYAARGMHSPIEHAWSSSEARQAEWSFAHTRMSVGAIVGNQQQRSDAVDPVAPRGQEGSTRDKDVEHDECCELKLGKAACNCGYSVLVDSEPALPASPARPEDAFQARVKPWLLACFGAEIASDREERNHRFLEEALELVQACGCTRDEARQLVDYVFDRQVGDRLQETGGVMVTLAALCLANDLDMHEAGETELQRVWGAVEKIRAKQAAKPKHSPFPALTAASPARARLMADLKMVLKGISDVVDGRLLCNISRESGRVIAVETLQTWSALLVQISEEGRQEEQKDDQSRGRTQAGS